MKECGYAGRTEEQLQLEQSDMGKNLREFANHNKSFTVKSECAFDQPRTCFERPYVLNEMWGQTNSWPKQQPWAVLHQVLLRSLLWIPLDLIATTVGYCS